MHQQIRLIGGRRCAIVANGEGGPCIYWGAGSGEGVEKAAELLRQKTGEKPWRLIAFEAQDWNAEFSPWSAPAVFGKADFAGEASKTLEWLTEACIPAVEETPRAFRAVAGYSLAGLFSLWAFYESGLFQGAASCSGSLWFPGWLDYVQKKKAPCGSAVYLSLGEREERTRNRAMAAVGDATRRMDALLEEDAAIRSHTLCWHPGGHFNDVEERLAAAMSWLVAEAARENG